MKEFTINNLYASAWESAIDEVATILNNSIEGANLSRFEDWVLLDQLADRLNFKFTVNGEIIK